MRYHEFQGLSVSALGFGMMRLPRLEDGRINRPAAREMVKAAFTGGVNYFDTAYKYHDGESEDFCGEVLAEYPRDSYFLADKLPTWLCETRQKAEDIFSEQLRKCRTDYFDFYLLHSVDEEHWTNIEKLDLVSFIKEKKDAGLARHIGFSAHCQPALLEEIFSRYGDILEFVQIQLNYLDWDYIDAKELYAVARKYNKPLIIMEPLRGGMLAELPSEEAYNILTAATKASGGASVSKASYGLRFVDQLPGVFCTLSGMSTLSQVEENIAAFSGAPLTEAELAAIPQAVSKLRSDIMIPCTACDYCYECPSKIKIPQIFKLYNNMAAKNFIPGWDSLSEMYAELGPNAHDCIGCGNCESHCPQKIDIIARLQAVDQKFAEVIAAHE